MAFYQNLKFILDSKNLSNYEAAQRCGMPAQTIDNIINSKVRKPKQSTLDKLSKGLDVSKNKLMYGTECFDIQNFNEKLESKKITLEKLAIETCIDPTLIIRNILPPLNQQESVAKYLDLPTDELFIPLSSGINYLQAQKIKPYRRPDINLDPKTNDDMSKLYDNLSAIHKKIVYNLAYDLSIIETEYIIELTPKDYWEK